MVEAKTAKEARKLQEQYIEGFYGETAEESRRRESRTAKRLKTVAESSRLRRPAT
jgi:hypothetical protein